PSIWSPSIWSPANFSPSIWSPSIWSPSIWSPSIWSPSIWSPSICSPSSSDPAIWNRSGFLPSLALPAVPDLQAGASNSTLAVSANDATADEHIEQDVWNNTGYFYIRVSGRNGAFASGGAFKLTVDEPIGPCLGVLPSNQPLLNPAYSLPGPGYHTLIL